MCGQAATLSKIAQCMAVCVFFYFLHMLNTEDVACMVGSFDRVQINIETNVYNDLLLPLSNRQLAVQPSSSKKSKKNSCVECLTFREPRLQS